MTKIYPKLDYGKLTNQELIQKFVDAGFDGIELYTTASGDNSYNSFKNNTPIIGKKDISVKSIHAPIGFKIDEKDKHFNLAYENSVADKSLELLADVAKFSKRQGCNEITIHSWFIEPPYEISKEEAQINMAKNLSKIKSDIKDVRILAEVSPLVLWGFPNTYDKQTIMVTTDDYQKFFSEGDKYGLNLGWDADIDHMLKTAIFKEIYGEDAKEYFNQVKKVIGTGKESEFRNEVCKNFLNYYLKNTESKDKINEFISEMLVTLKDRIGHMSVTGTGFILDSKLNASQGMSFEHLPVGYKGEVLARDYEKGFAPIEDKVIYVEDEVDLKNYLNIINNKPLVLEFSSREPPFQKRKDYDFFEQSILQKKILEDIINK